MMRVTITKMVKKKELNIRTSTSSIPAAPRVWIFTSAERRTNRVSCVIFKSASNKSGLFFYWRKLLKDGRDIKNATRCFSKGKIEE